MPTLLDSNNDSRMLVYATVLHYRNIFYCKILLYKKLLIKIKKNPCMSTTKFSMRTLCMTVLSRRYDATTLNVEV